jgi:hypothetical protein
MLPRMRPHLSGWQLRSTGHILVEWQEIASLLSRLAGGLPGSGRQKDSRGLCWFGSAGETLCQAGRGKIWIEKDDKEKTTEVLTHYRFCDDQYPIVHCTLI